MTDHAFVAHNPETKPFRDAAAQGKLLVPRCRHCGRHHWYPRAICPFCMSTDLEWLEASGKGEIYSFSVMRVAKPPYAIAYVTLDEGPRMMTNIVDADFDALRIGQKVVVTFVESEPGLPAPFFRPA
jgi:uncharacterized OB-fold protein